MAIVHNRTRFVAKVDASLEQLPAEVDVLTSDQRFVEPANRCEVVGPNGHVGRDEIVGLEERRKCLPELREDASSPDLRRQDVARRGGRRSLSPVASAVTMFASQPRSTSSSASQKTSFDPVAAAAPVFRAKDALLTALASMIRVGNGRSATCLSSAIRSSVASVLSAMTSSHANGVICFARWSSADTSAWSTEPTGMTTLTSMLDLSAASTAL